MKAIMISIKPKWVADILNHKKTIEVRKSMPKCDLPIDVYIYCTKEKEKCCFVDYRPSGNSGYLTTKLDCMGEELNGKVVAKFTLNKVEEIKTCESHNPELLVQSCLNADEFYDYLTKGKNFLGRVLGYVWHISNLVIFDKPKELSEFKHWIFYKKCERCPHGKCDNDYGLCSQCCEIKPLTKAPQSWGYVEVEDEIH